MKRRAPLRPIVESCESRTLLSGLAFAAPNGSPALVEQAALPLRLRLAGSVQGTYAVAPSFVAPAPLSLNGSGRLVRLGQSSVSGLVQTGLPPSERPDLNVQLSTARGTVSVHLTGIAVATNPNAPQRLRYTITSGTGAYQDASGSGVGVLRLLPDATTEGTTGRFLLRLR